MGTQRGGGGVTGAGKAGEGVDTELVPDSWHVIRTPCASVSFPGPGGEEGQPFLFPHGAMLTKHHIYPQFPASSKAGPRKTQKPSMGDTE